MNSYSYPSDMTMDVASRATFIKRTYQHLAGAVAVFALLSGFFYTSGISAVLTKTMFGNGRMSWLIVLGLFMLVSYVANRWAQSDTSQKTQYAGLGLYVVAEAVILAPMLYIAANSFDGVITKATFVTVGLFLGLTWVAFSTKTDFTFMGGFLKVGGMIALGLIVAGAIFGFNMGLWFSGAMILLVGGMLLYQTSGIMRHYLPTQHVAASLGLFASLGTLFWYVLQIFMSRD